MTRKNESQQRQEIMASLTVKSWTDPEFNSRLIANPREILEEYGLKIPDSESTEIIFLQDSPKTRHFVIPSPPESLSLAEGDLLVLAAQRLAIQLELF